MLWGRTIALCAALSVVPTLARAQGGPTGSVRYMAGYTHEAPAALTINNTEHDLWSGVVPELSYLFVEPRWTLRSTYALTAIVHTRNPAEIGNRVSVVSSFEVSKRTTLLLSADANQTSLSNYLNTPQPLDSTTLVVRPTNTRLLTTAAHEGLTWEASRNVGFEQGVDATYVTSVDPQTTLSNLFVTALFGVERTWKRDGVGVELRGAYSQLDTPPNPEQKFVTLTAAPRWRHDISASLTSSLAGGASLVVSPDERNDPLVAPFGRAALLYTVDPASFELSYAGGAAPSLLTGQMLVSHQVGLRAATPLSERHRVVGSASVGYLHGSVISLRDDALPRPNVESFLSSADVTWLATDWVQLFLRGVFIVQDNGIGGPLFAREAVTLGLQFSTRSPDGVAIPLRFPQRVDRGDAPARE